MAARTGYHAVQCSMPSSTAVLNNMPLSTKCCVRPDPQNGAIVDQHSGVVPNSSVQDRHNDTVVGEGRPSHHV